MRTSLWIGAAGFLGAVARYQLDGFVERQHGGPFPWGTLVVNLTGCFLLGLVAGALGGRAGVDPALRLALTVGFLGAYTTFSTFSLQAVRLAEGGAVGSAAAYVTASVVVGLGAAWAGLALGRAV